MLCKTPKRIRNLYTKEWMFVPCGECECCQIQKSIGKSSRLSNELSNYGISLFITLTYTNEHIPFIVDNSHFLCRCEIIEGRLSVRLEQRFDYPFKVSRCIPLNGKFDCVADGVNYLAVIYKKDYQNLFKRIRKHGIKFKYFICGELGSLSKRPHFHAIIRTDTESESRDFERLLRDNWKLHDWDKIDESCIQRAGKGVGNYLSSYVNWVADHSRFLYPKWSYPFTRRSNEVNYGFDKKEKEVIQGIIKKYYGREIFDFVEREFRVPSGTRLDNFSVRLVPSTVFMSYFPKCKGYCHLSFVSLLVWTSRVFRIEKYKSEFARYPDFEEQLTSLDMNFFRGFKRVCLLLKLDIYDYENFVKYVRLHYQISSFYSALQLKEQMLGFETMSKEDYYKTLYNTGADDPSYIQTKYRLRQLEINDIPLSIGFHTSEKLSKINNIIRTNHYKVLPKHLNSIINKNNDL